MDGASWTNDLVGEAVEICPGTDRQLGAAFHRKRPRSAGAKARSHSYQAVWIQLGFFAFLQPSANKKLFPARRDEGAGRYARGNFTAAWF
jgi:hypothetical protein